MRTSSPRPENIFRYFIIDQQSFYDDIWKDSKRYIFVLTRCIFLLRIFYTYYILSGWAINYILDFESNVLPGRSDPVPPTVIDKS